jgi:hypothetical protein
MASKGGHWKGTRFARASGSIRSVGGIKAISGAIGLRKIRRGLTDSDVEYIRDAQSFRESSFGAVRSVYKTQMAGGMSPTRIASKHMDPIRLHVESSGKIHVNDGRHRLAVAREMGAKRIRADVTQYGPRGGVQWQKQMTVRLR